MHGAETKTHADLKRRALIWAQARGYSACAFEVKIPRSPYRADVAAYRSRTNEMPSIAIFECKQSLEDLRQDNGCVAAIRTRLEKSYRRRQVLEQNLRIHYPQLRIADSLFAEFDSHDFAAINHKGYSRVLRELSALQNRLFDCTKFETLIRHRCANLFYLVLPHRLFRESEIPSAWGVLVESDGDLTLVRKPTWHETTTENHILILHRIAAAGTRALNRQLAITFADILALRGQSCP